MKKVDAFVAVELTQGPHLEEESVKDGLYGFRNIVCWKNRDLQLSGNPRVKRFWSGYVKDDEVLGDNHEADQVKMEPLERAKLHCLNPALHWPCLHRRRAFPIRRCSAGCPWRTASAGPCW